VSIGPRFTMVIVAAISALIGFIAASAEGNCTGTGYGYMEAFTGDNCQLHLRYLQPRSDRQPRLHLHQSLSGQILLGHELPRPYQLGFVLVMGQADLNLFVR
jgi:hypothetical protein